MMKLEAQFFIKLVRFNPMRPDRQINMRDLQVPRYGNDFGKKPFGNALPSVILMNNYIFDPCFRTCNRGERNHEKHSYRPALLIRSNEQCIRRTTNHLFKLLSRSDKGIGGTQLRYEGSKIFHKLRSDMSDLMNENLFLHC